MEECRKAANIPVQIKSNLDDTQLQDNEDFEGGNEKEANEEREYKEMKLVKQARDFYLKFRGLIADNVFTFKERTKSRRYFLSIDARQAFKVIQIELNFIYDVFFTKVNTLHRARGITRVFSFFALTTSFLLFYFEGSHNAQKLDICITYVLLGGALSMEVIAVIMLSISDWVVVTMMERTKRQFNVIPCFSCLLERWLEQYPPRRWCQEISQYDFFYYCLNPRSTLMKILYFKRVKEVIRDYFYVSPNEFDQGLEELIFEELTNKSKKADTIAKAKKACEARGDLVFCSAELVTYSTTLMPWTLNVDYDESLLLWHIVANLCNVCREFHQRKGVCNLCKIS